HTGASLKFGRKGARSTAGRERWAAKHAGATGAGGAAAACADGGADRAAPCELGVAAWCEPGGEPARHLDGSHAAAAGSSVMSLSRHGSGTEGLLAAGLPQQLPQSQALLGALPIAAIGASAPFAGPLLQQRPPPAQSALPGVQLPLRQLGVDTAAGASQQPCWSAWGKGGPPGHTHPLVSAPAEAWQSVATTWPLMLPQAPHVSTLQHHHTGNGLAEGHIFL
ncbi:hypothetical protein MNEG_14716, partial [Monoraphidium neglectum]